MCNNAGTADELHWRKQVDVNLSAVIEGTYLGIEHMRTHGTGGCIINTASLGGILPQRFCPVYSATKVLVSFVYACAAVPPGEFCWYLPAPLLLLISRLSLTSHSGSLPSVGAVGYR